ncbi:cupin domain-containing protein [Halorientalis brevis]|uniref:Cupin domain-containing protein n=1 Tax=Halorientalis brevis TaxID=1126241 RepID=A0ABD6CAV9_9EURY|nr:cupin domain-containing protein [Halorientalis brevis]
MGYQTASTATVDSVIDDEYGGMWFLKDALGTDELGLTIMALEPGAKGKEHDHSADGQEEVYCVVDGIVDVDLDDETVTLGEGEAIRIDPDETRQLYNRGDQRARLVLAGAPV